VARVEIPAPDPAKLLQSWMEWERGDVTPGRVMANLKTGGLRPLLESLVPPTAAPAPERPPVAPAPENPPAGVAPEGTGTGPGASPAGSAGSAEGTGPPGGQPPSWTPIV
jgi:hypothetical protein